MARVHSVIVLHPPPSILAPGVLLELKDGICVHVISQFTNENIYAGTQ